jgi:hypothetical protein
MKTVRSDLAYRHAQIIDFCLLIKSFFPRYIKTQIPEEFTAIVAHLKGLEESEREIVEMLIVHLGLLNQHYRVSQGGNRIVVAREDIFTAFYITGILLNPEGFMTQVKKEHYKQLQMTFMEQEFNSLQAREALLTSKTNTHRILHFLIAQELLQITKVVDRGLFYYKLKVF